MKPIRIGMIGCGAIAQWHARALAGRSDACLLAVADLREDAARQTAAEFQVERVYFDPHALLADNDVDAVILALPACVRTDLGIAAFRAGKHVLTEKPVAMNAQEVRSLIAARGNRVGACCSARPRFTEIARRATQFIASGNLGELRHLRCRSLETAGPRPHTPPPLWRMSRKLNGGGILMNWGCYDLDFLLGICGWSLVPRRVLGSVHAVPPQFADRLPPGSDAESHAIGFVRFHSGVTLSYERAELYSGPSESVWEITGSEGSLKLDMMAESGSSLIHWHSNPSGDRQETVLWSGATNWEEIHKMPARDFVAAIHESRPPCTTLEQAIVVAKITEAIYRSASEGKAVDVPEN